jgi:hypothetical protein
MYFSTTAHGSREQVGQSFLRLVPAQNSLRRNTCRRCDVIEDAVTVLQTVAAAPSHPVAANDRLAT